MQSQVAEIAEINFTNYVDTITQALENIQAREVLAKQTRILIKPNLINDTPPPVTTPVECCEAIIDYLQKNTKAEILVGEGCGEPGITTDEVFANLGYKKLASKKKIKLLDLNESPLVKKENEGCRLYPHMYLPQIVFKSFLISVPVLKAHSIATITGTLKNMMGLLPPKHYSGGFGIWKKSRFHHKMQQSIIELNLYRQPDLTIFDATIGLQDFHLGGRHCSPPVNKILAGFDSREIDRKAAQLLGLNWKSIKHLQP